MKLQKPSVAAIRANLIIEKLNSLSTKFPDIRIAFTGRTVSGKTTCANLLIGIDYFLESTGYQDCTDEVSLVEFTNGLSFVDLPGVASDDRLENYNRVAMGLNERKDFPQIEKLTIARYKQNKFLGRTSYGSAQWREQQLNPALRPGLIFYFIAPHQQFSRDEAEYLRDLLRHNPQVVYIFNLFVEKNTGISMVTPQNIADCNKKVTEVHHQILGNKDNPLIIKLNCWTGEGLDNLLAACITKLGEKTGKLIEELISYQKQKTPQTYAHKILEELLKELGDIASKKPSHQSDEGAVLNEAGATIRDFLAEVFNKSQPILVTQKFIKSKAKILISECIEPHYEDVLCEKSRQIPVPINKTVPVDDYSRPRKERRYRPKFVFFGKVLDKEGYDVITGYEKKPEVRFSHWEYKTQSWQEKTGEQRLVGYTYHSLNQKGIIFLVSMTNLFMSQLIDKYIETTDLEAIYYTIQRDISQKILALSDFPNPPSGDTVSMFLAKHLIFRFDFSLSNDGPVNLKEGKIEVN